MLQDGLLLLRLGSDLADQDLCLGGPNLVLLHGRQSPLQRTIRGGMRLCHVLYSMLSQLWMLCGVSTPKKNDDGERKLSVQQASHVCDEGYPISLTDRSLLACLYVVPSTYASLAALLPAPLSKKFARTSWCPFINSRLCSVN